MIDAFYVYIHKNKETSEIFYVGKGTGNRYSKKSKKDRSHRWHSYTKKHDWYPEILFKNLDEEFAYFLEEELISKCKTLGIPLVNFTKGGFGGKPVVYTEHLKSRISKTLIEYYKDKDGPRKNCKGMGHYTNGKANKIAWSNLDLFWRYYQVKKSDSALSRVFPEISRTVFKCVVNFLEKNGDPLQNENWIEYQKYNFTHRPKELPFYFCTRISQYETMERIEEINDLVCQGFGQKAIISKLNLPYTAITVYGKLKSGFDFKKDPVLSFCNERNLELKKEIT